MCNNHVDSNGEDDDKLMTSTRTVKIVTATTEAIIQFQKQMTGEC